MDSRALQMWRCALRLPFAVCVALLAAAMPPSADPAICRAAAERASRATGVPLGVLMAISLTETGRRHGSTLAPWPWTLNIAGDGFWLETRAEAVTRAARALAAGTTSFDMGCFQINYRWHGASFDSLDQMIDPDANARYAAGFLAQLFEESGDWSVAAGHYHSRTPHFAQRYRRVFDRHLAALGTGPLPAYGPPERTGAPGGFPLLQTGGPPVAMGSLVPDRPGRGFLFGGRAGRSLWGG